LKEGILLEPEKKMAVFTCESVGILYEYILKSSSVEKISLGKVISSFPSSLNIRTSGNELLVMSLNKISSPITINVKPQTVNANFTGIADYGCEVNKLHNRIAVGTGLLLQTGRPRLFRNRFIKPTYNGLNKFKDAADKILYALRKSTRSGCLLEPDITNEGLLDKFITETVKNISRYRDDNKFAQRVTHSLMNLCGRGPGFTPSGDDFICGFTALFNWLSLSEQSPTLSLPMQRVYHLTSWISFKFIEYYQRIIVDEQIQDMINAVGEGRTDQCISLLEKISCRGHTSGVDIGTGFTSALFTFSDRFRGTKLLDTVQRT
jgi:hypothetical protein